MNYRMSATIALLLTAILTACNSSSNDATQIENISRPDAANQDLRPNIVLYVADDHGTDAFGVYGNPIIDTPNLDALAAEGILFTHAFGTSASCAVTRSVLMTGLQNHKNGMYGHMHEYNHFSSFSNVRSLPVMLSEAGYRTARIGKFHLAPEQVYAFGEVLSPGTVNDMASIGRSPIEMADATKDFISLNHGKPFFLLMASDDPHRGLPFELGDQPNAFGNKPEGYPGIKKISYDPKHVIVPPFLPDIPETRLEMAQYYESVTRLDQGVGYMIKLLKEAGVYDNTIFIYLSDNGIAMPGAKTTQYDPGLRLPLVIRTPNIEKPGFVQNAMISWVDITPTILDFANATPDDAVFHGKSFKSILETENPPGWDEVYGSHSFHELTMYYPMRTVRTRKHKLIWNIAYRLEFPFAQDLTAAITWRGTIKRNLTHYGKRPVHKYLFRDQYELYDLETDPDEANNLANEPAYAQIKSELLAKIREFQTQTEDPWLHKWDYE